MLLDATVEDWVRVAIVMGIASTICVWWMHKELCRSAKEINNEHDS